MNPALALRQPALTSWQAHLAALGLVWAILLALFVTDVADIVGIWWASATFNHCLLVAPIIAWLVWQRLPELKRIEPGAWSPGLWVLAVGALAWLVGEASSLALARHFGLILMLQGAVVACLGRWVSRGLAFPLFYAFFLVPFGEELVPPLQTVTALLATGLLDLFGVPAHLDGIFITTPFGYFEVAEACAGVQFLIAMIAFGALVANVCFRSWRRRIAFMAASILIPVLANGVRAWGIIQVAHITSIDFAVGFDHVIYGGLFFAVIIALILAVGWPFFERAPGEAWINSSLQGRAGPAGGLRRIAPIAILIAALPVAWSASVSASGTRPVPPDFVLPQVAGWTSETAGTEWTPSFAGADLLRVGRYRDSDGRFVDLAIAVYARQDESGELVGYGQGAAGVGTGWAWTSARPAPPNGRAERIASHGVVREVVSFYRVGDKVIGSDMGVKLETLKVRLFGGPQRAVAILISSPAPAAGASPRPAIDRFLTALGPIDVIADRASGLDSPR